MSQDLKLKQAVLDELAWEPSVNAGHVGVTATSGVVTLTGHVQSYSEKAAAEDAAKRVKGVKAVVEDLEVQLAYETRSSDEDIASAAISRLKWDTAIPLDAVMVTVEKGWVTLTGAVDWHYQRTAASGDIRGITGVVGVVNHIAITPKAKASNVRDGIVAALRRSWFDPQGIDVVAVGGQVKLTGTVHSWTERAQAGTTAWAAPGVTSVENDIRVD